MNIGQDSFPQELETAKGQAGRLGREIVDTQNDLNEITEHVNELLRERGMAELPMMDTAWLAAFQEELERQIEVPEVLKKAERLPKLSAQDIVACCICGLLAAMADAIFVGTPQLRDGKVNGAPIQQWLRAIDGNTGIFKWLSEHCTVPYDISAVKDTVYPLNHRLRSLAHDPLFGALFALLDICLGTTTCVNNAGQLVMLPSPKGKADKKAPLFLLYYLGHLLSDAFTTCGLPVPGWFLTQFFTSDDEESLARAAEDMYKNGFDTRQLIGMCTSAQLGIGLTECYMALAHPPRTSGSWRRRRTLAVEARTAAPGIAAGDRRSGLCRERDQDPASSKFRRFGGDQSGSMAGIRLARSPGGPGGRTGYVGGNGHGEPQEYRQDVGITERGSVKVKRL